MTSPAPLSLLATTSQQPVTVVTKNQPAAAATIASQLPAAAEATTAASHLHPATMAHQPEGLTPQDRGHQAGATMVATMDKKTLSLVCRLQTSGSSSSCYLKPPKFCSLERL